ncbi:hypothetical protein PR202_gb16680 [Eleusine coracana subsp. coracana]|uniref:Pentatricopeptide repeat-containing protein n=1 Tax=Eleusine coracana subsp. coracana TaxID=191504 RepID=A0AAV5F121_ELECO|nr:hypothetical protein PR202_gb16680 [Eleusine coracana subsp. coracana]
MPHRNLVSWTAMVSGYMRNGAPELGLGMFVSMVRSGLCPNEFPLASSPGACQSMAHAKLGHSLHCLAAKVGLDGNPYVGCSLLMSKGNCHGYLCAYGFFSNLSVKNVVTWNEMIAGYGLHCYSEDVVRLFHSLLCFGERPDEFTYSAVLSAFQQAHDTSDCSENPDEFILASILNACANSALIRQCRCIHSVVFRTEHSRHFCVASALVDASAKCGDIYAAESAFTAVSSQANNAIMYNTMLTAYANHGLIEEALSLYQEMAKLQLAPTPATFVAVISACNHLGLVEQGKLLFSSMLFEEGMNPRRANYACLIDHLAWKEHILRMMPSSDGAYVSLSNVYAEDGEWQSAEDTRRRMVEYQVQKVQGYSSVEI